MYLKLLLNFNLYKNAIEANDNDYYNLEYLFGIVHSVYEWDPRCTLKKTYILKNIFNFNEITLYDNKSISDYYVQIVCDFLILINKEKEKSNDSIRALELFYTFEKCFRSQYRIYYIFIAHLYKSNFISTFLKDKQRFFKDIYNNDFKDKIPDEENLQKILQLFILIIIQLNSSKDINELNQFLRESQPGIWTLKGILASIIETESNEERINYSADNKKYIYESSSNDSQRIKEEPRFKIQMIENCVWLIVNKRNEFYNPIFEENNEECYQFMVKVLNDILGQTKVLRNYVFSDKVNICFDLFMYRYNSNKSERENVNTTILNFSFLLFQSCSHPFIFKILYELAVANDSYEIFISLFERVVDFLTDITKQTEAYTEDGEDIINMNFNLGNLIVLLFTIEENQKNIFLEEKFNKIFFNILNKLPKTYLFYSHICFQVYNAKYYKSVSEMIFDILYDLCCETKNVKYYDSLYELFLYNKSQISALAFRQSSIEKNRKNKTMYHNLYFFIDCGNSLYTNPNIKADNIKRIEKTFKDNIVNADNSVKVFIDINYSLFFLAKLLMYISTIKITPETEMISKLMLFIAEITTKDLYYLRKKNSKTNGYYQENRTSLFAYNRLKDIFEKNYYIKEEFEYFKNEFEIEIKAKLKCYNIYKFTKYLTISTCKHQGTYFMDLYKNKSKENSDNTTILSKTFTKLPTKGSAHLKQSTLSEDFLLRGSKLNENSDKASFGSISEISKNGLKSIGSFGSQTTIANYFQSSNTVSTNVSPIASNENKNYSGIKKDTSSSFDNDSDLYEDVHKDVIIKPKSELLLAHFGNVFKNVFFYNEIFVKMKMVYGIEHKCNIENKQLNYPSKVKHYSNGLDTFHFLKQDMNFFNDKYFNISHSYFKELKNLVPHKTIAIKNKMLTNPEIKKQFYCEFIGIEKCIFGRMKVTKFNFYFEKEERPNCSNLSYEEKKKFLFSDNSIYSSDNGKEKTIVFYPDEIKEIIIKRYLLLWQAVEISLHSGKSYFFNFFHNTELLSFFSSLDKYFPSLYIISNCQKEFSSLSYYKQWNQNMLSTYDFLLAVNKFSSRTFLEPNQYPIFPWLLLDYSTINDNNKMKFRNLLYPIPCQTEEKKEYYMQRYSDSMNQNFKSHLGTHYSTSSYVYYYLMRMDPYSQSLIKLQGNAQENANRMFLSISETQYILENNSDCRELIPEFFSTVDYMVNLNCNLFGYRKDNTLVDDILFNNTATLSNYVNFVIKNRNLLERAEVKKEIPNWINYIFGCNQLTGGRSACNIFKKETYADKTNLEVKINKMEMKYSDIVNGPNEELIIRKIQDKISIIVSFGNTPARLFNKPISYDNKESKNIFTKEENNKIISKKCSFFTYINNKLYFLNKKENKIEIITLKDLQNAKNNSIFIDIKNIKLFHKIKVTTNKKNTSPFSYYLYKPNYSFALINNSQYIINVRNRDNSITITSLDNKPRKILCNDFITAISSNNKNTFYTGSLNGKLTQWEFSNNTIKIIRSLISHESQITCIEINNKFNIIATAGNDNYIYIRKTYNFELLVPIKINNQYIVTYMKFSHYDFLYVMCYNKSTNKMCIFGYTLSGLQFTKSDEGHYNNFTFTSKGNLIVGTNHDDQGRLFILQSSDLKLVINKRFPRETSSKELVWIEHVSQEKIYIIAYRKENSDVCNIELIKEENLD